MENIILMIFIGICALVCLIISAIQFMEKGIPFNNTYLYATEKERAILNKKPLYKQSGIVFSILAVMLLFCLLAVAFKAYWIFWIAGCLTVALIIYAVISSIKEAKTSK